MRTTRGALALAALAVACSDSGSDDAPDTTDTGGTTSAAGGRAQATGGRTENTGGREEATGGRATTGGRTTTTGGREGPGTGGRPDDGAAGAPEPSDGSCGLAEPAFCDGFDAPPRDGGRSGELDPAVWSGARAAPSLHPNQTESFLIGPASIPECREGVTGERLYAERDAIVCEPTAAIQSRHLLMTAAAQNYGLTSYRIRRPFDFEGRAGTLVFDLDPSGGGLGDWPAVVISQDPTPLPSFDDPERGSGPRNGLSIEFGNNGWCGKPDTTIVSIHEFHDYAESVLLTGEAWDCNEPWPVIERHSLNHFELKISQDHLQIWASDLSLDGVTFTNLRLVHEHDIDLDFTRGYVNLSVKNHATIKYWVGAAGLTRWDNVGFDGPVIAPAREYSAPDEVVIHDGLPGCLVNDACQWIGDVIPNQDGCPPELSCQAEGTAEFVGSVLPALESGDDPAVLTFMRVDTTDVTRARLAIAVDYPWFSWNDVFPAPTALAVHYRVNGGPEHDRFIAEDELGAFEGIPYEGAGILNQIFELDPAELIDGTNTIELWSKGTWTGSYAVAVTAADLVLDP
jgi:hypothetical protein